MGARELKEAFNEVAKPAAVCQVALLEYLPGQGTEWQILFFSGNYADGTGFSIKSDRLRPGAEVNDAARATAEQLLQRKRV
jgi:hypothetical protein